MSAPTRRVAVVGSGVSGLVAGWVLARDSHVTLYEADDRLGGHADTHDVQLGDRTVAVDTGFIVHNERTYPTLLRLFAELGIPTQESDMSMSVRDEETGLEWAGALGASGLFPNRANLRNPRYLRMLTEIPRFHRMARKLLATPEVSTRSTTDLDETLGQFLERGRFTDFFVTYFMTPLVSAVWSTDPDHALDYPARYLFRFLEHHGMLTVFGSPTWRTVTGGSREYVRLVAKNLHAVRLSSPVAEIREHADGVDVTDPSGTATYDAVVVATHPDQALAMLAEPTPLHREVLGAIRYQPNVAQLHTDERLLPRTEAARASWNYQRRDDGRVLVTYDMTRLQRLDLDKLDHREAPLDHREARFLVSLGAQDVVDPSTVIATMRYAHPVYTPASVAAQSQAAAAQHAPRRLRRRLPRLGLPRGRRTLRPPSGAKPSADAGPPSSGPLGWRRRRASTPPRSSMRGSSRCATSSATAATPGWSTSTTCRATRGLRAAAAPVGVLPGPRPRRRPRPQPAGEHRRLPRRA